jgi:hypothetical protein
MIEGFLGSERFEVKVRLEGDKLLGRVGGALMARDVKLDLTATGVTGRVGGSNGFDLRLSLEGGELIGFVGNDPVSLRGVDVVVGTLGDGFSAQEFGARQSGSRLIGSIGGLLGKPFSLDLGQAPGWLGALVVLVAFYALEKHKSA